MLVGEVVKMVADARELYNAWTKPTKTACLNPNFNEEARVVPVYPGINRVFYDVK